MTSDPAKQPKTADQTMPHNTLPNQSAKQRRRTLLIILCVAAGVGLLIAVPVIGYLNEQHERTEQFKTSMRMIEDADEIFHENQDRKEIADASADSNISYAQFMVIKRKVEARATARHDLKQAQDDFNAGHIGVGELHRIQREVRDRVDATSP